MSATAVPAHPAHHAASASAHAMGSYAQDRFNQPTEGQRGSRSYRYAPPCLLPLSRRALSAPAPAITMAASLSHLALPSVFPHDRSRPLSPPAHAMASHQQPPPPPPPPPGAATATDSMTPMYMRDMHTAQMPYPWNPPAENRIVERYGTKSEFSLDVAQQPDRARMCGFGDKDRRPITPPICVRLVIRDISTGREIDVHDISSEFFVLQVDLFNETGQQEVNLVRHSSTSPSMSISMASTAHYPPPPEMTYRNYTSNQYMPQHMYGQGYQDNGYGYQPGGYWPGGQPPQPAAQPVPQQNNNFTRNLIGSTNVSAAMLNDTNGTPGFWFVLQDLSVRQEGMFRLKMSFFDLSSPEPGRLAPSTNVLATAFSEPFQVHSAKRFPGVKESTALSKCFAGQGVKIPIRKDGANRSANGEGGDDD